MTITPQTALISLAQLRRLVVPWTDVTVSNVSVDDYVRVKLDAYANNIVGDIHNGRLCRVISVASGEIVVRSVDQQLQILQHFPNESHFQSKRRHTQNYQRTQRPTNKITPFLSLHSTQAHSPFRIGPVH